ncbi:glutamate racemase [Acidovorax carolinensis]|uniref:Glutamate racemase n=1 Tax=Acidovorax carolinensis TaxID=553814 RepID=A0A240UBC5_9BURK|nr:glutamate racemase [Acidovorax carolinensis]ART58811.1 glutamate racemase [Acidovorax carolinensis]
MNRAAQPIGVFDSGIGGLSVLQALRAELPHERFVYLADSGNAPYGDARGDAFVSARTHAITRYLREQHHIKALVVACNTATAAAIHEVRSSQPDLPAVGLEPALKPAAVLSKTGRVGVIGTRGTLTSEKFSRLLASVAGQAEFVVQPCDGLARAIENSTAQPLPADPLATETKAICERYISAMGPFGTEVGQIDTLVLGCTHYVFVADELRALVGPQVRLIETGEPVARQTRRLLHKDALLAPEDAVTNATASVRLLTTGALGPLQAAAERWLQLPPDCCDIVAIP